MIKKNRADWVQPLLDWSAENLAPGVQVPFHLYHHHQHCHHQHHHHHQLCHHHHHYHYHRSHHQCHQPDLNPELELDLSQLHFGSHSSGGHVAVEFLKKGCSDVKV